MHGLHLTADLRGCDPAAPRMTQPDALRRLCRTAVDQAGLTAVGELFHRFPAPPQARPVAEASSGAALTTGGVTGVVLLAESHLAVHTWPELGAVTLDVYVCNLGADNSAAAEGLLQQLVDAFAPGQVQRQRLLRGLPD